MISYSSKTKDQIICELQELKEEYNSLKASYDMVIHHHRLTEETLRISNEFNNTLLQTIPFGMDIVNEEGTILFINGFLKQIFGEQALGRKCWELYHNGLIECSDCPLISGIKVGESFTGINNAIIGKKIYQIFHTGMIYNGQKAILEIFVDITDGIEAHNALKKSEKRFKTIFEDAPLGVALVESVSGKICEVNQMFAKIVGRTMEELTNFDWISITHPDDLEADLYNQLQLVNGKTNGFQMEKRYIRPDGSFVWINMTISRLIKEDNMPMQHICMIEEITERKKIEEAIRRQADLLNLAYDSIIVKDLDSKIIYWNKGATELYGWMGPEVMGKIIHELLNTSFPVSLEEIMTEIDTKEYWEGELTHMTKDGSSIIVSSRWQLQKDKDNHPVAILEINHDITARKQIEEALRSKTSLLEAQLNSVTEGILVVDEQNKRVLINQRFIELINAPGSVLAETDDSKLLNYVTGLTKNPNLFLEKINYLNRHTDEKSHDQIEFKNGMILDRYSAPVLGKDGNNYGRIWTFRDITAQKSTELQIKMKNEELLKVNAQKDKFYSLIAHDLRGPLGGFMVMTELMVEEEQNFTEHEKREMTLNLRDSARNTFTLLEQLLEWSKIERGISDFKPMMVDLRPVVDESLKIAAESAKIKSVELSVEIPVNILVFADPNMMKTVIRNLVSNAVKFTPSGGKVTVFLGAEKSNLVEIAVKDTGIGMSEEIIENLFRLDVNTKRPGTSGELSTGLGLLLCKEFVEKQGGKINIASQEGKGSVFSFTVPAHEISTETIYNPIVVEGNGNNSGVSNLKILITEDDAISGKIISSMVRKVSSRIIIATTGAEAVTVCRNNPDLDLILMDIAMPQMNGYEVTRQIRTFNKDVIIVAQTSLTLKKDIENALEAGCNAHISKPIDLKELMMIIEKYFNK